MHRSDGEAPLGEVLCKFRGRALGAGEDDGASPIICLEDLGDDCRFVHAVGFERHLAGGVVGAWGVCGLGADVHRRMHFRPGEGKNRAGHRGGEEHGLHVVAYGRPQRLDIGQEPHVQHLVRLVQHEDGHGREVEIAPPPQIDQPPGRADDHVHALLQRSELLLVGPAAVDRGDAHWGQRRRVGKIVAHLHRELAGGHNNQRPRGAVEFLDVGVVEDTVEQRHAEAEGLAHAGPRLPDDVPAYQRPRQRQLLDRKRAHNAALSERIDDFSCDA